MRFLRKLLSTVGLCFIALSASATPADPKNGVEYLTLESRQNTESGKKIEVIEFFGYFCPHCNVFDPSLTEWVKKQGDNIVFKRIHIAFGESMVPQQRLYFALEAMGKTEEMHKKIFAAIHNERQSLNKEEAIIDFVVKQGIDKQKFVDTYNSFAVQTKARRATQMQSTYKIDGVPTIVIDGQYLTSPSIAGKGQPTEPAMQDAALKVMDVLVARARPAAAVADKSKKATKN
ncbi:MAG: thiol:disulfide interchange protein DsbA/DsbL [Pseudomonadota bacterium]